MNRNLVLKRLREIGLTDYESKSYLALMEKEALTVSEVAKIAGIPRPNAYGAMEKLMEKGLCLARPGATKKYSASDPDLLEEKYHDQIDLAIKTEIDDLNKKEAELLVRLEKEKEKKLLQLRNEEKKIMDKGKAARENITGMIQELQPFFESTRGNKTPLDFIEVYKDFFQIFKRFHQLCNTAKEEILVMTSPPQKVPSKERQKEYDEAIIQEGKILKRGVKGRCIYELSSNKEMGAWQLSTIKRAVEAGEEARVIKKIPIFMAVFDSRIVMTTLNDPIVKQSSVTTQVTEHADLAKVFKITFETLWEQAEDYRVLESNIKGGDYKR